MRRGKQIDLLQGGRECLGSYDEWPCVPEYIDPMPYLSHNRVPQPFFLSSAKDRMLAHLGGIGRVEFRDASVNYFDLECGDFVYLPADTPAQLVPETPCLQLIYRGHPLGEETAHWYCPKCRNELYKVELKCGGLPHRGYWQACQAFNQDEATRRCKECRTTHPAVDLSEIKWLDVAAAIEAFDKT